MIQALKVAAIIVLAVVIVFVAQRALFHYLDSANADETGPAVTFVVHSNESSSSVANRLHEAGLIRSATYFKLKMRLTNADAKLRAGDFTLHKGMSIDQIIASLTTAAPVKVINVRFQEGWRSEEYADKLVQVGLISTPSQLLDATKASGWSYDFLKSLPSNATLEGFLFPDTYQFQAGESPDDIINTMLQDFNTRVPPNLRDRAQKLGYNLYQVITVASIIEREAQVDSERPIIASVYYNRLKQNMPLDADPTVQYALGDEGAWWPVLKPADIDGTANDPYNTYRNAGFPPGPICNPSLKSIEAALNPAKTDYLYFVAKSDGSGTHAFAKTLKEQNQNIQKYSKP